MLTDSQIRSAKPSDRPQKLADSRGLYLCVMPNGGRYWSFDYRYGGKRKALALGVYSDVLLATARTRHQDARRMPSEGIDPAAQKQVPIVTLKAVAREWCARWKPGRNQQYAFYVLKRLETDIFPEFGRRAGCGYAGRFFSQFLE